MASYPAPWIPLLWGIWLFYWVLSAAGRPRGERQADGLGRFAYQLPIFLAGILMFGPRLGPEFLGARFMPETVAAEAVGTALVVLGLLITVVARVHLGVHWNGRVAIGAYHRLVRSGPYRFVRHPIYSGALLALFGTTLAFGDWRSVPAFVIIALALWYKLRREERRMAERFKAAYVAYRAKVAAIVPLLL